MTKPRFRYRANGTFDVLTHDGYVPSIPVSGDHALQSLESGSPGWMPLSERPVFIISGKAASCSSNLFLKYPNPHALPGRGYEPHRAFFPKANHDLSLSHEVTLPSFHSHGREK